MKDFEDLEKDKDYLSSLKSIETENYIDRIFYRPIGYWIASKIQHTGITPNAITILSIFVGIGGASLFFFDPLWMNALGILLLICANILDCVDGQLARLTGIKSEWGRILDGLAGDFWFITLYIAIASRMYILTGHWIFIVAAVLSMLSHFVQAAMTDLYKTFHLRSIGEKTGQEFETYDMVKERISNMKPGFSRFTTTIYSQYTRMQSLLTPQLQRLVRVAREKDVSDAEGIEFRRGSMIVMKLVDLMTFNGRTIPLFLFTLLGHVWFYFIYEAFFLNIVLFVARSQHETLCKLFADTIYEKGSSR